MVLLGLAVRGGATPVDVWFQLRGAPLHWLLVFTDPRTVGVLLITALVVALVRRLWALLPMIVLAPFASVLASSSLKPMFGRMKEQSLAYPSGHTTVMVVALGMLILAVGARRWLVVAAAVFAALGVLGQSVTRHYFTDAVGAVLLGTSLVCVFAAILHPLHRPFTCR
jgi:membrane-associated phospholipid phosphatase